MLETALGQLRFAASILFGVPFDLRSLERLVDALRETHREFGAIGSEAGELIGGPALDEATRREVQLRRFRAQAVRGARETAYYRRLFQRLGLDPARLRHEDIPCLPLTPKQALRTDPDAFVRRTARPYLRAMTTGTTGRPTTVYFSEYELRVLVALSAAGLLLHHQLSPEDIVQISTSSRATLGNISLAGACARIGALTYLAGQVEAGHALALLAEERHIPGKKPRTSALSIYPSYLGELVEYGLREGYQPDDFGLERIFVGGEVVTEGLKVRSRQLFGRVQLVEGYGMTETLPFGGQVCSEGHLHFEISQGLLELINPETGSPARPGEAGTIVATPFPPYRDTTVLLRYDTEDVVRPVAGPLTCRLRNLPATSGLLGKLRLCVRREDGWTFPRDVLEALEAVEEVPLPARCGFWAMREGVAVEVVAPKVTPGVRRKIETRLEERGVPVQELLLIEDRSQLRHPIPLRCDLRETSFSPSPTRTGSGDEGNISIRFGAASTPFLLDNNVALNAQEEDA
jgi:phenylacetate-CoA ligase